MNKHKGTKDNARYREKLQKNIILNIMGWSLYMDLILKWITRELQKQVVSQNLKNT